MKYSMSVYVGNLTPTLLLPPQEAKDFTLVFPEK